VTGPAAATLTLGAASVRRTRPGALPWPALPRLALS